MAADWIPPRSPAVLAFKGMSIAAACLLLATLAWRIGVVVAADGVSWMLAAAIVLGYASSDLLSGSVHWFCDTFFSPRTPVIGPVIFRFRDHHDHPQHIVEYGFLDQDTNNFLLMMPLLGWLWWSDLPAPGRSGALFAACYVFALCCGSLGTNLFHKWAHDPDAPRAVRWLQRAGIILSPERHWTHHRDHSRGFCVTSGWMNVVLDPIRFFPRLERVLRALLPPRRIGTHEEASAP